MNIYYSFNDFMNRVIEEADGIARQRHGRGLEELFEVSVDTFDTVKTLIDCGWYVFLAVAALLVLSMLGFFAALTTFLLTPPGLIVAAVLGAAAAPKIKKMYKEKILPLTVKEVGEQYKNRWDNANNNPAVIDRLLNEAAHELYRRATSRGVRALIGN